MKTFSASLSEIGEIGYVVEVLGSLVYVDGLPTARPGELVYFETGDFGEIQAMGSARVEILLYSKNILKVGVKAARSNEFLQFPVGAELLGQTIDALGNSLKDKMFKRPTATRIIDQTAAGILSRKRISKPLDTGVIMVDLIVPLGKGQRELVIGDRKTGKTQFLLQTILTQAKQGTICIYAAIGKKKFDIKKIEEFFSKHNITKQTVIIASAPDDPQSLIYLTPYSAMSIAEYFRDQGVDVLLVFDDLLTHAKFYREISLLARRFPGRNSYPGDIFYTHAKLLERAGNFITPKGEYAITCLPVVETSQGDISGYIQTNLVSITDGHIYFDNELFSNGRRPAINSFLSVTRVGRQTQTQLRREVNRELNSFLTLFEKMQRFVHFGAELSETIRHTIQTGEKILTFFDQSSYVLLDTKLQLFLFGLLWVGTWQTKSADIMRQDMGKIIASYEKDESLAVSINTMITKSDSFNALLTQVREKSATLLKRVGMSAYKN